MYEPQIIWVLTVAGYAERWYRSAYWGTDPDTGLDVLTSPPAELMHRIPGSRHYTDVDALNRWSRFSRRISRVGGLPEVDPFDFELIAPDAPQLTLEQIVHSEPGEVDAFYAMTPSPDQWAESLMARLVRLTTLDARQVAETVNTGDFEVVVAGDPGGEWPRVVHVGLAGEAQEAMWATGAEDIGGGRWRVDIAVREVLHTERMQHRVRPRSGGYPQLTSEPCGLKDRPWRLDGYEVLGDIENRELGGVIRRYWGYLLGDPTREGAKISLPATHREAALYRGVDLPISTTQLAGPYHRFDRAWFPHWQVWPRGAAFRARATGVAGDMLNPPDPAGGLVASFDTSTHQMMADPSLAVDGHPRALWIGRQGADQTAGWRPTSYRGDAVGERDGVNLLAVAGVDNPPDIDLDERTVLENVPAIERIDVRLDGVLRWPDALVNGLVGRNTGQVQGQDGSWFGVYLDERGEEGAAELVVTPNWPGLNALVEQPPRQGGVIVVDTHRRMGEPERTQRADAVFLGQTWPLYVGPIDGDGPRPLAYPVFARGGAPNAAKLTDSAGGKAWAITSQGHRFTESATDLVRFATRFVDQGEAGAYLESDATPVGGTPFTMHVTHYDPWETDGDGTVRALAQVVRVVDVAEELLPDGTQAFWHQFDEPLARPVGDWPGYERSRWDVRPDVAGEPGPILVDMLTVGLGVDDGDVDTASFDAMVRWPGVVWRWPTSKKPIRAKDVIESICIPTGSAILTVADSEGNPKLTRRRIGRQTGLAPKAVLSLREINAGRSTIQSRRISEVRVEASFDANGSPRFVHTVDTGIRSGGAKPLTLRLYAMDISDIAVAEAVVFDYLLKQAGAAVTWQIQVPACYATGIDIGDEVQVAHPDLSTVYGTPTLVSTNVDSTAPLTETPYAGVVIGIDEADIDAEPVTVLTVIHYGDSAPGRNAALVLTGPVLDPETDEPVDDRRTWQVDVAGVGPERHPVTGAAIDDTYWWRDDSGQPDGAPVRIVSPVDLDDTGGMSLVTTIEAFLGAGELRLAGPVPEALGAPVWLISSDDPADDVDTRRAGLARFGLGGTIGGTVAPPVETVLTADMPRRYTPPPPRAAQGVGVPIEAGAMVALAQSVAYCAEVAMRAAVGALSTPRSVAPELAALTAETATQRFDLVTTAEARFIGVAMMVRWGRYKAEEIESAPSLRLVLRRASDDARVDEVRWAGGLLGPGRRVSSAGMPIYPVQAVVTPGRRVPEAPPETGPRYLNVGANAGVELYVEAVGEGVEVVTVFAAEIPEATITRERP